MFMLSMLMIFLSLIFIMMKHPLSLGSILLIQTINMSLIMGLLNFNFYYSYILFIIMVGGMLILFMYMTSIASNEKFKFSMKIIFINFMMILLIIFMMKTDNLLNNLSMNNYEMKNIIYNMNYYYSISKFITYPNNMILIFMIFYLLITMIAVVKISFMNKGPLRQFN